MAPAKKNSAQQQPVDLLDSTRQFKMRGRQKSSTSKMPRCAKPSHPNPSVSTMSGPRLSLLLKDLSRAAVLASHFLGIPRSLKDSSFFGTLEYNTHYRNETSYEQQESVDNNTMAPLDLIPYQIDYSSKNVGKTVANSKKKIEFKFGFANNDAISHGQKGVACRGVEHKVVLKWSLTSGKTVVECDMKEIHFGLSGTKVR